MASSVEINGQQATNAESSTTIQTTGGKVIRGKTADIEKANQATATDEQATQASTNSEATSPSSAAASSSSQVVTTLPQTGIATDIDTGSMLLADGLVLALVVGLGLIWRQLRKRRVMHES